MLCEICGEREATLHYSEDINGVKTEHYFCSECAAKTDMGIYSSFFDSDMRLGQLIASMLGNNGVSKNSEEDEKLQIACPSCGMTYGEFTANSKFGCAECYDVFGPLIEESIKKVQGSVKHIGKRPRLRPRVTVEDISDEAKAAETQNDSLLNDIKKNELAKEIEMLSMRLKAAILEEDFDMAAKLRDSIKAKKEEMERRVKDA